MFSGLPAQIAGLFWQHAALSACVACEHDLAAQRAEPALASLAMPSAPQKSALAAIAFSHVWLSVQHAPASSLSLCAVVCCCGLMCVDV